MASAAVGTVIIMNKVYEINNNTSTSILTFVLAGILALWICWYFGTSYIYAREAVQIRRLCEINREKI